MSIIYDPQTSSLHIVLVRDVGESYEPKDGRFVVYIDENQDQTEIVIEGAREFLTQAANSVTELTATSPVAKAQTEPVWEDVDSSMISAFKYNDTTMTLEIIFNRTGLYRYFDVPADVVEDLRASSSKGSFMRSMIIGSYDYEKGKGWR